LEQLNIVGKRSGDGFVAHKAALVNALSRGLAHRLLLMDFTVGRKGLLGYLKALSGSNTVKVVPTTNGSASGERTSAKRLKVVCGSNTSYLEDMAWVGDKTPYSLAEVRISPDNTVKPNVGSLELSEALNRVLPFTATDDTRPVLQNVMFVAGEGKLKLVSADGFRLAVVTLDYEDGEGQVLVPRDELKGIANALRKAKRVRLGFEASGDTLDGTSLIIDTEATRYKWRGAEGEFPNYEQLIPSEFSTVAHLDTVEAIKAVSSFRALSDSPKDYPIDLTVSGGQIVMANPDERGETMLPADTDGEGYVRIDGRYLADVLKACGGMVDFKLTNAYSPVLFSADGYQVVVMPLMSNKANEQARQDREAAEKKEPIGFRRPSHDEPTSTEAEAEAEAETSTEAQPKRSRKRSRKREPVAVA